MVDSTRTPAPGHRAGRSGARGWRRSGLVALLAGALFLAAVPSAPALPPARGVLVPGESLGGLRLGMTKAQVRDAWGSWFGRCRACPRETWYFNYRPFMPQGAGVAFVRGRAQHVFTIWQPTGWRTTKGLTLGANEAEVTRTYGESTRRDCGDYDALSIRGRKTQTVFYLHEGELWGFGINRPGSSPCL